MEVEMKRILLMFLRSFFQLPLWLIKLFRLTDVTRHDANERYAFLRYVTPIANRRGRITIECYGEENLPKQSGYIMYPNHQGMFDALAIIQTNPQPFSVISKKEVQNVFLLKQVFQLLQAEFMDREDVRQSMTVISNVAKRVKSGENFVIFAEGTRSKHGNEIGSFKPGSFKAAYYAKAPILPVALVNAFQPFDSDSIKPVTVQIHYLPPIPYEEYKDMKTAEIAELVSGQIRETIIQSTLV